MASAGITEGPAAEIAREDTMKEAPLWRFALRLWRDKRIERVCLRLQDEHGVPVAV
ncbi:MAG TPA: hypothetical protein DFK55_16490, partial [Alcanivorax sp.]|nr:hypothetical protein [Alcanivorax sp.]